MGEFTDFDITQEMIQAGRHAANLPDSTLARIYLSMRAAERGWDVGGNEGPQDRARRRIQALGAAISRRSWHDVETAHAAIRDAHDRPEVYDRPNVG